MVKLHIKHQSENEFLLEISTQAEIESILKNVVEIHNGKLKIERICLEMEDLAIHGISLRKDMQGLTDEQIEELKLIDIYCETHIPSGGFIESIDPIQKRNGKAPNEEMCNIILKTTQESKARMSKKQVECGVCLTMEDIQDCIEILKGALKIVYPMGLPPYDPVQQEFDGTIDLSSTQAQLDIIKLNEAQIWWAGKELQTDKKLSDYIGKNEKTKIIVKLQKTGLGPPSRESSVSSEEQKQLMLHHYKRQEELKRLEENDDDDSFLNSAWADSSTLKKSFQGLKDVKWKPR